MVDRKINNRGGEANHQLFLIDQRLENHQLSLLEIKELNKDFLFTLLGEDISSEDDIDLICEISKAIGVKTFDFVDK